MTIGTRARILVGAAAGVGIATVGYSVLGGDSTPRGGSLSSTRPSAGAAMRTAAATQVAPGSAVDQESPGRAGPVEDLGPPKGVVPPESGSGTDLPSFPLPGFVSSVAPAIAAPTQPGTAPPQVPSFSPPPPASSTPSLPSFPNFSSSLAFSSFPLGDPFASFPLNNPFSTFPLSGFISSLGSGSSIFPNLPFGGSLAGLGGLFPLGGSLGTVGLGGGPLPSFPLGTGLSALGTAGAPSGLTLSIGSTFPPGTTIPVAPGTKPTGTTISVGVTLLPTGTGLPIGSELSLLGNSSLNSLLGLREGGLGDLGLLESELGLGDIGLDRNLFRHPSFDHQSLRHLFFDGDHEKRAHDR